MVTCRKGNSGNSVRNTMQLELKEKQPVSPQDKTDWCRYGEEQERNFCARTFLGLSVAINPAKKDDKFTHDLFATFPSDLKSVKMEFHTAQRYGIPPQFAVTLNLKDVERYRKKYPNMVIIFDISHESYVGVHVLFLQSFLMRLSKSPAIPIHEYIHRRDDTSGNGKASYVLDCRLIPKIA